MLMFDFSQDEEIIKDVWRKAPSNKKEKALCWSLSCKSEPSEQAALYFDFSN
jgi:hypothetical protein